ncbi:MAG: 30S ribosomal protein S15 [Candidatus Absconditabacterales bacterium]
MATTKKIVKKPTKQITKTDDLFQRHEKDTGSPEVQILYLSNEIQELQEHLIAHKKDYDAKRSLLKKVAKRRTLLKYLKQNDLSIYNTVSKKLNLKV